MGTGTGLKMDERTIDNEYRNNGPLPVMYRLDRNPRHKKSDSFTYRFLSI